MTDRIAVDLLSNLARTRERLAAAAARAGRRPDEICLVAVSKVVEAARVQAAIDAGLTDLGENYVQEAAAKQPLLTGSVRWHMIGRVQRNKAALAAQLFDIVHTVDSLRLAQALGAQALRLGRPLEILLQVNTSGEDTKSGVPPGAVEELWEAVQPVDGITLRGLMTIGTWDPDPERTRPEYRQLARLAHALASRSGLSQPWLSMGMSHDFEVAIEEGATLVRVGTGIFGPRPQSAPRTP